jgi:hypothetical protein
MIGADRLSVSMRLGALLLTMLAAPGFAAEKGDGGSRPRVAVFYFEPHTPDVELQVFTKGLAALMISDLAAHEGLNVVERERLADVQAEIALGQTRGAVGPDSGGQSCGYCGGEVGAFIEFGKAL